MIAVKPVFASSLFFVLTGLAFDAHAATPHFRGTPAQADAWLVAHPAPGTCSAHHHPEAGSWYSGDRAKAWSGCIRDGYYRDVKGKLRPLQSAGRVHIPDTSRSSTSGA
ncbi:hypothetical protein [Stenotrophomonas sp. NLF4-10]|uniref:hypothetical protein n=1 Tax=Stenotrophomonas sp. NLF4-10 TaxID=2918754 RepID=UPI001EFA9EA3|nr:hypothetical protein [Stenotrophomonas sp. NLF4-10]MCG8276290.1 hypothetical protein [Stenotrophomonas sp. NLF4-10]